MLALAGKTILQLRKRLGEDWPDLALYFDISRERCKGFAPGREFDGIVAWLKEQDRLGELAEALAAVDRDNLIPLLEAAPSSGSQTTAPTTWPDSPFPGLRRFNPEGRADLLWPLSGDQGTAPQARRSHESLHRGAGRFGFGQIVAGGGGA